MKIGYYLPLLAAMGLLAGCATAPDTFNQVDTATVHFLVPKLQLLPKRTPQAQDKGGVVVSVEPVLFSAGTAYQEDLAVQGLTSDNFLKGLIPQPTPDGTPERFFTETQKPIAILSPKQLSFQISVTNHTDRTLKIDPVVVVFVDSRGVPVPNSGFSMSLAPGTHQTATLTGPEGSEIFQGNANGTIILALQGIRTDPFDPSKGVNFQWDYDYVLGGLDKTMPIRQRSVEMSTLQAQQLNGKVVAQ